MHPPSTLHPTPALSPSCACLPVVVCIHTLHLTPFPCFLPPCRTPHGSACLCAARASASTSSCSGSCWIRQASSSLRQVGAGGRWGPLGWACQQAGGQAGGHVHGRAGARGVVSLFLHPAAVCCAHTASCCCSTSQPRNLHRHKGSRSLNQLGAHPAAGSWLASSDPACSPAHPARSAWVQTGTSG